MHAFHATAQMMILKSIEIIKILQNRKSYLNYYYFCLFVAESVFCCLAQ